MINRISHSEQNIKVPSTCRKNHNIRYFNLNYINLAVFMLFLWVLFLFVNTLISLFIISACKEGYFGINCSRKCSPDCKPDTCRHTDGWCLRDEGLKDGNCTTGTFCRINIFLKNKLPQLIRLIFSCL